MSLVLGNDKLLLQASLNLESLLSFSRCLKCDSSRHFIPDTKKVYRAKTLSYIFKFTYPICTICIRILAQFIMSNIFLQKIKGVIAKEFKGARHPQHPPQGGASSQQQVNSNTGNGNQGQFYGDSGTQHQYSNQQQYYGSDSSQQQAYTGYGNQQQYNDPNAQQSYAGYGS